MGRQILNWEDSWVGDEIHLGYSVLVLDELFLMKSVEMLGKGLCLYSVHLGFAGGRPLIDLERLVLLLIRGFKIELSGLVMSNSNRG